MKRSFQETTSFADLVSALSIRAKHVLERIGITSITELLEITREEMLETWFCGEKTAKEIEELQRLLRSSFQVTTPSTTGYLILVTLAYPALFRCIAKCLNTRANRVLAKMGVTSFEVFMELKFEPLEHHTNCGQFTIKLIRDVQVAFSELHKFAAIQDKLDQRAISFRSPHPLEGILLEAIQCCLSSRANQLLRAAHVSTLRGYMMLNDGQLKPISNYRSSTRRSLLKIREAFAEVVQVETKYHRETPIATSSRLTEAPRTAIPNTVMVRLSTRAKYVLRNMRVETVKALISLDEGSLLKQRNCGIKTTNEILRLGKQLSESGKQLPGSNVKLSRICDNQELAEEVDDLLLEHIRMNLPANGRQMLDEIRIASLEDFMLLEKQQLIRCNAYNEGSMYAILRSKKIFTRLVDHLSKRICASNMQSHEFVTSTYSEIYSCILGCLKRTTVNELEAMGVKTTDEFMKLDKYKLIRMKICSPSTGSDIFNVQIRFSELFEGLRRVIPCLDRQVEEDTTDADQKELPSLKRLLLDAFLRMSERDQRILRMHFGWNREKPLNLAEIGRIEGISRERVRQLVSRAKSKIQIDSDLSNKIRDRINSILENRQKPFEVSELVNEEPSLSGFALYPETLVSILRSIASCEVFIYTVEGTKYLSNVSHKEYEDLVDGVRKLIEESNEHSLQASKLEMIVNDYLQTAGCQHLTKLVLSNIKTEQLVTQCAVQIARTTADEFIAEELWSTDYATFKQKLTIELNERLDDSVDIAQAEDLLKIVFAGQGSLRKHASRIFSKVLWQIRFGAVSDCIEQTLKLMGKSAHYDEIGAKAAQLRPRFNSNTYAALNNSDNCVLWGRGIFIHKDNIRMPFSLINDVETWLLEKLSEDVPFVLVNGAYEKFQSRCELVEIETEVALYTCLRLSGNSKLVYPWYPSVYLMECFSEHVPMTRAFENYICDAGGTIPQVEVKQYWTNKVFLTELQYFGLVSRMVNIILVDGRGYCHLENVTFDKKCLNSIKQYILVILRIEPFVSIERVYSDKRVTCTAAGIIGPMMLHYLLRCFYAEELIVRDYPTVAKPNKSELQTKVSVRKQVVKFILNHGKPCHYQELEQRFVKELGYKEQSIYAVAYDEPDIARYHPSCLIHLKNLDWSEKKQDILELVASQGFKELSEAGYLFGRISHLVEGRQLPMLPNELHWSADLVGDLLKRSGRFHILGSAREAYAPLGNKYEIHNFESLVALMLKSNWGGAANHKSFQTSLIEQGIIKKSLTSVMLEPGEEVVIRNAVVMLKELEDA